jgi:phosphate transport system substrate-binding protein
VVYNGGKWVGISWSLLWVVLTTVIICTPAHSETIRIGGTGNALGTMKLMADAYSRINPKIKITVLASIGSSGAIRAVPAGAIEIGLSSRPLKEAEAKTGIRSVEYARSPTVIATSSNMSVDGISVDQLVNIYSGTMLDWPDGSLIRPIIRQPGDDNTVQLKGLSPALKQAIEIADERSGLLFASTDQETVDKIQNTPGSFGVTTLALIISEKRPLRALKLDGVEPTPDTCNSGQYPLVKHFYLILPSVIPPHVQDFIEFIKSTDGALVLTQNGNSVVP